jgi:SNF2 family DNA or RNA helicase
MEVISNTAVRFHCPSQIAYTIKSYIMRSELLKDDGAVAEVIVHWELDEMQRLARLTPTTIKVPSPIERDYSWPGMFMPFDHQRDTSRFLSLHRRAFCFNEAGTGKTSAAIWAADYLMNQGKVKRALVICPLSIMQSAWQADLFKTAMHRTCAVAHGATSKREKIIRGEYQFVIINYDGVNVVEDAIKAGGFDLIIIDEANAYKNPSTKRWKTLARLISADTYLWMMTGTPAAQSPEDAFGLAKLVNPEGVPRYKTAWKDKVMKQLTRFKWIPKPEAQGIVFDALQPAIRYEKAQCLDLPDVVYQTRMVPLSPQANKYYRELLKEMQIKAAGEVISTVNAAASLTRLLQLSGGAVYTDDGNVVEFDVTPRLSVLHEVLDEAAHKVIIFVPFKHTINLVSNYLTTNGFSHAIISGDVTANNRSEIFKSFQQHTDPRVLLIQPQSASHGVTLTAADTVVFWSPVMSVETYLQCVARIDRVGQKNSMTVIHLQGSEVEKRMYTMLQNKVDLHERLVDLYRDELEQGESNE